MLVFVTYLSSKKYQFDIMGRPTNGGRELRDGERGLQSQWKGTLRRKTKF